MDANIHSLIAACRTANQKWQHEDAIYIHQPGRGRAAPPSPAQMACEAFLDASRAMEEAVPKTMAGWLAKWRQVVSLETQYDYGDADYNLAMAQQMLTELAPLVLVEAPQCKPVACG
jgi:hypothetical protein